MTDGETGTSPTALFSKTITSCPVIPRQENLSQSDLFGVTLVEAALSPAAFSYEAILKEHSHARDP